MELFEFNKIFKKLDDDSKLFLLVTGFDYKKIINVVVNKSCVSFECDKTTTCVIMK